MWKITAVFGWEGQMAEVWVAYSRDEAKATLARLQAERAASGDNFNIMVERPNG